MRGWAPALLLLIAIAGAAIYMQVRPHFGVCKSNNEIAAADRESIDAAALQFVTHVYEGRSEEALGAMAPGARTPEAREILAGLAQNVRAVPGANRAARERYTLFHIGPPSGASPCASGSDVTTLANGGGFRTAFVVVAEDVSAHAERSWTFWLSPSGGRWQVRQFNVGLSAFAGRDATAFLEEARRQQTAGHGFNATLLFDLARQAADRGTFFQSAVGNRIADTRAAHARHPEIATDQPSAFVLGERSFPVSVVRPHADAQGKLALILVQPGEWRGETEAEGRNRALIDAMNAHRGEWREVFDYLVVQAPMDQPEQSWGTVFRRDGGYLSPRNEQTPAR